MTHYARSILLRPAWRYQSRTTVKKAAAWVTLEGEKIALSAPACLALCGAERKGRTGLPACLPVCLLGGWTCLPACLAHSSHRSTAFVAHAMAHAPFL